MLPTRPPGRALCLAISAQHLRAASAGALASRCRSAAGHRAVRRGVTRPPRGSGCPRWRQRLRRVAGAQHRRMPPSCPARSRLKRTSRRSGKGRGGIHASYAQRVLFGTSGHRGGGPSRLARPGRCRGRRARAMLPASGCMHDSRAWPCLFTARDPVASRRSGFASPSLCEVELSSLRATDPAASGCD